MQRKDCRAFPLLIGVRVDVTMLESPLKSVSIYGLRDVSYQACISVPVNPLSLPVEY
jgi:hypothetical protein